MKFKCFLILVVAIFIIHPNYVVGDDSAFWGNGYTVFPLKTNDIQLVSENIKIVDLQSLPELIPKELKFNHNPDRWLVEAELIFKNFGDDTSIQMGFPFQEDYGDDEEGTGYPRDFRTWVDGKRVKIIIKKGTNNPLWKQAGLKFKKIYIFTVHFQKGQIIRIKHLYTVGGAMVSDGEWGFSYILRTGALWKGDIEDFKAEYLTKVGNVYCITPEPSTSSISGNKIILNWSYKNFKPDEDIRISNIPLGIPILAEKANVKTSNDVPLLYKTSLAEFFSSTNTNDLSEVNECGLRFIRNSIFANYGYPFKIPWIRAQFYFPGSVYKEDPAFSINKIPKKILQFLSHLGK